MNPLRDVLDDSTAVPAEGAVREATAAALHALRHDRRLRRLDFNEAQEVAYDLVHIPDVRVLARYTFPLRPGWLEGALEHQRRAFNRLLFEVLDAPALEHEGIRTVQRVAMARGSQMRVAEVPFRLHVYDRRFALVPIDFDDNTAGAYAVLEPDLVRALTELHARMWQLGHKWDRAGTSSVDLADVLGELLEGWTDEASAQRLHISLRTYRRKVKELLDLLGARSRFQAGAVAEQRRYLDLVRPTCLPRAAAADPYEAALSRLPSLQG